METKIYQINQIEEIALAIRNGQMIAIPTDTVYGLAIDCFNSEAIENLKIAKGRPDDKPFPMMVSSIEQLAKVAIITERERKVIDCFMPGALTVIFNKREDLPPEVNNGLSTIGVRMPDDEFVLKLIELVGNPLLVPSANLSGEPSCVSDTEVLAQLKGRIDGVVCGTSGSAQASTIIDMSGEEIKVLRQGKITLEEILEVLI